MKKTYILIGALLMSLMAFGQAKLRSGNITFLKGTDTKLLKLEFSDTLLEIKGMKEEEFLKKYIEIKNIQKPGSGEGWAAKWIENKPTWEAQFESYLNASIPNKNIVVKRETDSAKYIMLVCPTELDPGYYAGLSLSPGFLNALIFIKDIAVPDKILATLYIYKAHIKKSYFVSNNEYLRVMDSYGTAGERLGKFLAKKIGY